jgi:acetylornithine deacetylase/succinyl-diaminopimelate desuccinylase-like protein
MESNTQKAIAYSQENTQKFIDSLVEFLKIKTISSDPKYKGDVRKGAEWLSTYMKNLGIEDVRILDTEQNPVVYGSLSQAGEDKPTILIYGHYDVQPVDPLDEWDNAPFEPVIKDGLLYARGSSDMKGQALVSLAAIESIMAFDKVPVNLKFLFEGDEEVGSPSIVAFLTKYKDLFKSDFVLNLDAGMIAKDKPTIVYGLRGLAYFEITVTGPAYDLQKGFTNVERLGARPTLDVNGIWGGYTGEGPKTVIPSKAHAKLSMRLVPNQTPAKVKQQLIQYLEEHAPKEVTWEVKQLASDPACITDFDFYATRCFANSLEKVMGKKPVFKREGGSIPISTHFQSILGCDSVLSGFSLPGDRVHSPNERFTLELFEKGIEVVIDYFYRLAQECGE